MAKAGMEISISFSMRRFRTALRLRRAVAALHSRGLPFRRLAAHLLDDFLRVHIADHADNQVRRVVERVVAELQGFGCNFFNALDRSGDVVSHRMVLVHDAEQVFHHGRVRAVVIHPDFLRDDAALFLHAFLRKIPGRDHAQQNLQIFFQMLRALDIVRRHGVARKGIVCPRVLCKFLHRVSLGRSNILCSR